MFGRVKAEDAFTLVELVATLVVLGVLILATTISIYAATRKTAVRAASEVIRQQISKTYSLAENGAFHPATGITRKRDQYRIEFTTNSGGGAPDNAYRIRVREYLGDGLGWDAWATWTPGGNEPEPKSANVKEAESAGWFRPVAHTVVHFALTGQGMTQEIDSDSGENIWGITFEASGSIVTTEGMGSPSLQITDAGGAVQETISVSVFGSVQ